jgi:hypothetical protein
MGKLFWQARMALTSRGSEVYLTASGLRISAWQHGASNM